METPTDATTDSKTAVTTEVPFDAQHAKPPQLESAASKRHRMNFLRRKAKSQDEDENEDEAEIKRLQRKVEYLEKKKKLVQKIKKIERGIEAADVESDDETSSEKEKVSPKRWRSFSIRRWKNRDTSNSFEDDLTSDDEDNSPLLQTVHSALDYIEDACAPIIKDLKVACTDLLASLDDDRLQNTKSLNDVEGTSNGVKAASDDSIIIKAQDVKSTTDETPEDSQRSSLAPMITLLTKQISQSFSRTEDAAEVPEEPEISTQKDHGLQEKYVATKGVLENDSTRTLEENKKDNSQIRNNHEQTLVGINNPPNTLRDSSQSLVLCKEKEDVGLGSSHGLSSNANPSSEPSTEICDKSVRVTLTAMTLSGLYISSKTNDKCDVPPVQAVLSVLNNTTSGESSVFTNVSSLRVVLDESRGPIKKNKFDRSSKYHVMGVWDISNIDKSSVTFSRFIGPPVSEEINEREVSRSPSALHLRVCIKRDDMDDILPVGVAKVLISGWEPRDVELAVPVRPEYYKSIPDLIKKLDTKPPQSKWESFKTFVLEDEDDVLSCVRFRGYKNETYRLEKDSFIRIRLKIAPDVEGQQSQLSGSVPLSISKGPITRSEIHGLSATSISTEGQDTEPITFPKGVRAVETTRIISNVEIPSDDYIVSVAHNDVNGGDPSWGTESFRKVEYQGEVANDKPSINDKDPYLTLHDTEDKENFSNGVAHPPYPVNEGFAEEVAPHKSKKTWFKKTKAIQTRKTNDSTEIQAILEKKPHFENNPIGVIKHSIETQNDESLRVMHSAFGVVEAEPTRLATTCRENSTKSVPPLDSADTKALLEFEKKYTDPSQVNDAGSEGSRDYKLQADGDRIIDDTTPDLSTTKQSGKNVSLKSSKSWFNRISKTRKTDTSSHLSSIFKEAVVSDPCLALFSSSSEDGKALANHEMVANNRNFREALLDTNGDDFPENMSKEIRRTCTTKSLTTVKEHGSQAISSEVAGGSQQVVHDKETSFASSANYVDNLNFTIACAEETSGSIIENSAGLQPNCDLGNRIVDEVHTEIMKSEGLDIAQAKNFIERDSSQLVNEYAFEVTPEDFLKAAQFTDEMKVEELGLIARSRSDKLYKDKCPVEMTGVSLQINGSDHGFTRIAGENHGMLDCRGKDCVSNCLPSGCERQDESEGIELQLKDKKTRKGVLRIAKENHSKP